MKKNSIFFMTFAILVSLLSNFCAWGQNKAGYDQCTALSSLLKRYSFNPIEEPLLENTSAEFPFNIILNFEATNNFSENNEDLIDTLVLDFNIQEAIENFSFTMDLLNVISSSTKSGNVTVVFSYGNINSTRNPFILSGSRVHAESIIDTNKIAAIPVSLSAKSNTIIPGSGGDCSPSWIIQLLSNSFFSSNIHYVIRGGILSSLYRLNFLKNDYRTGIYMMNGIPACGLNLSVNASNTDYTKRLTVFFSELCSNFDPDNTLEWDRHSRPVQIFNKTIILSEHFTVIAFITCSVLSLFFICQFSFIVQFNKRNVQKNVIRLWYLIPVIALLTTCAFLMEEGIAFILSKIIPIEPVTFLFLKLCAGFILISFVFFFFIRRVGIYSSTVYSYLMTITALLNLFIFSAIDISLFYLFLSEYILVNLSRPLRRTGSLITSFFVIALPFVPYVYQLIMYAETSELTKIVFAPFHINLIFSFAFLPFEFVWLRLLSRLNGRWRISSKKKKAFIKQNLITIGSAIILFIVILIVIVAFIPDEYRVAGRKTQFLTENATTEQIQITYRDEDFYNDVLRTINIKLSEKNEVITVSVKGETTIPILYSDEQMISLASAKTDYFLLPAWSPQEMSFTYIPDAEDSSTVTVTRQIFDNDSNTMNLLQQKLVIPAIVKGEN